MFLTRLGFGSKAVVTGDVTQIDLPDGRGRSGLLQVRGVLDGIDGLVFVELGRATSCATGSCRTSSTPTNDTRSRRDDRHDVCRRVRRRRAARRRSRRRRAGSGSRALVLADERVNERYGDDVEMSLLFVDETTIAELNERFLGGVGPTDVLAFPMDEELAAGRPPARPGRPRPGRAGRGRRSAGAARRRGGVPGRRAAPGARARRRPPTRRSRCSWCTACCTCSTTTTPSPRRRRRCAAANTNCSRASATPRGREVGATAKYRAPDHERRITSRGERKYDERSSRSLRSRCSGSSRACSRSRETAFTRVSRIRLLALEEEGDKRARRAAPAWSIPNARSTASCCSCSGAR